MVASVVDGSVAFDIAGCNESTVVIAVRVIDSTEVDDDCGAIVSAVCVRINVVCVAVCRVPVVGKHDASRASHVQTPRGWQFLLASISYYTRNRLSPHASKNTLMHTYNAVAIVRFPYRNTTKTSLER